MVDPDNTIAETNELNNTSALVNTTVGGPPAAPLLDIKKTDGNPAPGAWGTGAGPDPVNPGQKLTYKILVTNNATGNNARADDVVVTDATQGLEAASIVASQTIVNGSLGTTGGCVVVGAAGAVLDQVAQLGRHARDHDLRNRRPVRRLVDLQHGDGDRQRQEPGRDATPPLR